MIKKSIDIFIAQIKSKKIKQVGALYTSMVLGLILGVLVSTFNTRVLGPGQFGDLKFMA